MKILHCCLAAFYNDNYGYQENIMPRMHKLQGHDVMILASTEVFVDRVNLGYTNPRKYINENGIPVHRVPYVSWLPLKIASKIRLYKGVFDIIEGFKPDVLFLHDAQFLSIKDIVKYVKVNSNVKLFVDGHTDFGNSARTFLSKWLLHRCIYQHCINVIKPYVERFYGTLPARVDFFVNEYKTPVEKTELLVMGADDEFVNKAKRNNSCKIIRNQFSVKDDDFLIVTGGKFTEGKKQILSVMEGVKRLSGKFHVKLLIFGSIMDKMKDEFYALCDGNIVQYIGWINANESYNYFEAANLVIFPGTHSVLWEQAVGQGKPCIFKYIPGFTHIDIGGNCEFLKKADLDDCMQIIEKCIINYHSMHTIASTKGLSHFSYYKISERAILI